VAAGGVGHLLAQQLLAAGVFGRADAVLRSGPAAVAQFQVGELAARGAGGEACEPVAVDVGEAQLGAGCGLSLRTITRVGRGPCAGGDVEDGRSDVPQ
jgi:hypothetical protein